MRTTSNNPMLSYTVNGNTIAFQEETSHRSRAQSFTTSGQPITEAYNGVRIISLQRKTHIEMTIKAFKTGEALL